ncbi:uncharacterized protein [Rutidosis leptorrhynchoides]|uniref:uncharacterized protein n=1 Tax=Rutidosis leptorrhynchoides TaxID=125765 RepID=UPI003A99DC83
MYMHPSDYPKQMHVNEILTDNNYMDWSQEIMNFLFAKNKVGFVDGSIKKTDNNSPLYMLWMCCDAMVNGWLTTTMEKEIRTSVKYANSSYKIWNDLKERFGKESAPRAYELKKSLLMTHQDGTIVPVYYIKLRSLWDKMDLVLPIPKCSCEACTCNIGKNTSELKEKEGIYEFLMGLDDQFVVINTQILAMKPMPSLGNVHHLVSEDERQRIISADKKPIFEAAAFKASVSRLDVNQNHRRDNFFSKEKRTEEIENCKHCGKDGHLREGCFKCIGYPDWWPGNRKCQTLL